MSFEPGKKRLISIDRPATAPNHSVLSIGATERYVFRSRIEKPPSLVLFVGIDNIYDQMHM